MTRKPQELLFRLGAVAAGVIGFLGVMSWGPSGALRLLYDKVGITVIALLPLAVWSAWTAVRGGRHRDITLSYIGTTAQRVGLLGTVIGIVAATVRIGDNLNEGAANAVTGALPAVGQALISTAVGFVIALACDFFRYLQERESTAAINHENQPE